MKFLLGVINLDEIDKSPINVLNIYSRIKRIKMLKCHQSNKEGLQTELDAKVVEKM